MTAGCPRAPGQGGDPGSLGLGPLWSRCSMHAGCSCCVWTQHISISLCAPRPWPGARGQGGAHQTTFLNIWKDRVFARMQWGIQTSAPSRSSREAKEHSLIACCVRVALPGALSPFSAPPPPPHPRSLRGWIAECESLSISVVYTRLRGGAQDAGTGPTGCFRVFCPGWSVPVPFQSYLKTEYCP